MLASQTPVYAPLFWARILSFESFEKVRFVFPPRREASRKFTAGGDPLVEFLFHKDAAKKVDMIVCDPLRAIFCIKERFQQIVFARTFLRRLTFRVYTKEGIEEDVKRLITHPVGMTGHMLAVKWFKQTSQGKSDEDIKQSLIPLPQGNLERQIYERLCAKDSAAKKEVGFVTPDFSIAIAGRGDFKEVGRFDESEVMTAFLTTKQYYENNAQKVDSFLRSLSAVLSELKNGLSVRASFDLMNDDEMARIFKSRPNLKEHPKLLARMLDILVGRKPLDDCKKKCYFCDPLLASDDETWERNRKQDLADALKRLEVYLKLFETEFGPNYREYNGNFDQLKKKIESCI